MYKIIERCLTLFLTFLVSKNNGQSTSITITRRLGRSDLTEGLECDMKTQSKTRAGNCECKNGNTFYDDDEHCQSLEEISYSEGNMTLV